ncbi:hypothetical protein K1719_036327 [Acacia pycnantha]|nr:hypothetical protein K1719_036327 [Acacia pycnantha]
MAFWRSCASRTLTFAATLLLLLHGAHCFYLPSVAPQDFSKEPKDYLAHLHTNNPSKLRGALNNTESRHRRASLAMKSAATLDYMFNPQVPDPFVEFQQLPQSS